MGGMGIMCLLCILSVKHDKYIFYYQRFILNKRFRKVKMTAE